MEVKKKLITAEVPETLWITAREKAKRNGINISQRIRLVLEEIAEK